MREIWYRYDNMQVADDPYGEGPGKTIIFCSKLPVCRTTAKGVWVGASKKAYGGRFVLRKARKRYACPTKEEALESFLRRKGMQKAILTQQLKNCNAAIELAVEESETQKKPAPAQAGTGGGRD